ncbi:hypothetical protein PRUPE_5G016000 [Prunus persica]|uniref:Endonuclease/exonuclease/phosphatase domain-containing protein n=1 Tax=Prunus persica TaxID=3760 RepID=A0A251P3N4_PRUPE|nr:hypothetical protein PRUPE_5G016000 [Prunus persica]
MFVFSPIISCAKGGGELWTIYFLLSHCIRVKIVWGGCTMLGDSSSFSSLFSERHTAFGVERRLRWYEIVRAELLLEEKIEYNDLVDSILDGNGHGDDKPNNKEAVENKDDGPKIGSTLQSALDQGDPDDPRVRLKRDCVGIMAVFKLKNPSNHVVIVANTHLYWDPDWADVKLAQAKYLLSRLAQFKTLVSQRFDCSPSLILSGDFNSTPGDKVYQYLISGNSSSAPSIDSVDLPIPLCSAYATTRGEPPFTNYTPGFTGTLDYIFFSPSDCIRPVSFLELPEPGSSDLDGGLPNFSHPSDHLPIGVEFEISR